MYPRMAPHQKAIIVPGTFGGSRFAACDTACFDEMMAADARSFGRWANSDPRVSNHLPTDLSCHIMHPVVSCFYIGRD